MNKTRLFTFVALLSVALGISGLATAMDCNKGTTVSLCDNFGKTWSATVAACSPGLPLSLCLSGARDTANLLGCGPLPMHGQSIGVRYLFNAYVNEASPCNSTYWLGTGNALPKGPITGNVYNPAGLFGGFTLSLGACAAGAQAGASNDPAFIK